MAEPTPFALSQLFTQLIGRKVTFAQTTAAAETKIKQMYCIYDVHPQATSIIVKTDLPLLGSLAGVLVGLPDSAIKERLAVSPIEELLRDAINEVLNIASAVVCTEGRAVFSKMLADPTSIEGVAAKLLKRPDHRATSMS
jgi:hypothetical protein